MNIFITGANRGLGFSLTKRALERGHVVIGTVRKEQEELLKLQQAYPNNLRIVSLDIVNENSVISVKDTLEEQGIEINAIINNAAVLLGNENKVTDLSIADGLATMDVNVLGPIRVTKHLLPLLRGNKVLVNISSDAGSISNTYNGDYFYGISKAALNMFSEKVRRGFPDVHVYSIHPGWMFTDMGGEKAPLHPDISANCILDIIEGKIEVDETHSYINYKGEKLSY